MKMIFLQIILIRETVELFMILEEKFNFDIDQYEKEKIIKLKI